MPSIPLFAAALIVSWVTWYIWRFVVFPWLKPHEPRQLPYYVPWLGHTVAFMKSAEQVYNRGNRYFKDSRPYGITIAGGTTVVITDTADLAAVWKNTVSLSYDPFISRMLTAFGISKTNVQRVMQDDPASLMSPSLREKTLLATENPRGKCYMHLLSEWTKKQLLPGPNLVQLQADYLSYLQRFFSTKPLVGDFVISYQTKRAGPHSTTVSLGKFTRHVLSYAAFRAFFGTALFDIDPNFAQIYQKWEDDSWKVFYNYPYILAKDLHNARERAIKSLALYYELSSDKRKPCWLFDVMDIELRALGVPQADRAGLVMSFCWAINNNAHYICTWMLVHMLCDRPLIEAVRNETDTHIASDGTCDIDSLVTSCPNLDAVWNETLRLYIASTAVRKASANCIIGGKIIHKDDQIFGPARNWQLDAQYFGENAHHFDAGRWIRNKALTRSKGFTPFGGGQTYCPGRYFAQRETYSFIAILLQRYDLQVTHRDGCIIENASAPPVEVNLPAPAAMRPVHDVYVTLRERNMDM